jgi:hypothetical protein
MLVRLSADHKKNFRAGLKQKIAGTHSLCGIQQFNYFYKYAKFILLSAKSEYICCVTNQFKK